MSAPACGSCLQDREASFAVGIAGGDERNEARALRARNSAKRAGDPRSGRHSFLPSALATVNTSLSPRPERPTTMILSFASVGAMRTACGDGVRGFERGNDAFEPAGELKRVQRLGVGRRT